MAGYHQFHAVGRAGRFHLYEAQLKPWLWYATQRTDYRIFQHMTAPDMIRQVLADYPFEVRLVRNWEAATLAEAHTFIQALPEGLDR